MPPSAFTTAAYHIVRNARYLSRWEALQLGLLLRNAPMQPELTRGNLPWRDPFSMALYDTNGCSQASKNQARHQILLCDGHVVKSNATNRDTKELKCAVGPSMTGIERPPTQRYQTDLLIITTEALDHYHI